MERAVRVAVVGATGYAGAEAVRLLAGHPQAGCVYLGSHSQAGRSLAAVYPHLAPLGALPLEPVDPDVIAARADVALLSLPARESLDLAPRLLERGMRVVDFGADFRLRDPAAYARYYGGAHTAPAWLASAVYGLTEVRREQVRTAKLVANPGCYPTAAILALLPALRSGLIGTTGIVIDAKSGVTGAGRQPTQTTHFPEVDGGIAPYAVAGAHRHTPEIEQELGALAGQAASVIFTPHLLPASRGLLAACYAPLALRVSPAEALAAYGAAYAAEPFVQVLETGLPHTKAVAGSNLAQVAVAVDERAGYLLAFCAIDNLGKGAAGAAVQNLNVMFGLDEGAGLPRIGLYP